MNPNDENNSVPPTPLVNPTAPDPAGAPEAVSAGDEAALKAIEALDAESSQFNPEGSGMPASTDAPVETPAPTPSIDPVSPAPSEPLTIPTEPLPTQESPVEPVQPETPETPAAESPLDQVLSDPSAAPLSTPFQPFEAPKKASNKVRISLIAILVLLVLGVGGYFGWQYLQAQNTTTPTQNTTPNNDSDEDETPEVTDTEASVNSAVTDMQTDLDELNDAAYQDSTLSDTTLYQ